MFNKCAMFHRACFAKKSVHVFETCYVMKRSHSVTRNPSGSIWLQVLQSGQKDTSPGLYFFTDSSRYLINTGENTLRHLRNSGLPTKGLDRILLTGSSINHIGGLTNALLATQDRLSYERPITVYGPPNLEAFFQTIRKSFQYLSKFEFVKLHLINEKVSWQEILNDENCTIYACAVCDETSKCDNMIYPSLAISYAFKLGVALRKVSLEARERLGVPDDVFQKVVQECQKGNSVRLPCGQLIKPDDILLARQRKQSFLVIDCPSKHVLKTFTQFTHRNFFDQDLSNRIDLVMHMTPREIATTSEYKSWMTTFDCETKHLMLNSNVNSCPSSMISNFDKLYDKLSRQHPQVFPSLQYSVMDTGAMPKAFSHLPNTIMTASPSWKYIFRPQRLEGYQKSPLRSNVQRLLKTIPDKDHTKPFSSLEQDNDFQVVFLGTGSRVSSVLRNTSGILLNLRDKTSLLMDCGEGTYRQMCHHYGENIGIILKQLRTVFVSHMHIDHHLGLINILLQRKKIMKRSDHVRIIGPESLDLYLRYFEMLSGESLNFRFTQFWWVKRSAGKKEGKEFNRTLRLSAFSVVPTKHSDYSHGLVIERNGWKIVYSADTRPCKQLIDAGQNATLLIHEATFEDQLLDRAKATSHCTVSEAIRCSELMNAEHTILTHISNRHLFPCKSSRLPGGVSFAFDHMTVQQKDLSNLRRIMPSIEKTILLSQQGKRSQKKRKHILR